ncbi:MAG: NAD(P)H-dependent oxidoreductase [Chitinophagaceae bacterium]
MYNLKIIIASTRPGRKAPAVASWITAITRQHPDFNVEVLDLATINLPFLDEPNHPMMQKYQHDHTRNWSRTIDAADAIIMVTAEYNHSFPAPLKNALDFLYKEWNYKPVAFVSYGGIAAGTRAVQMLKQVVTALRMVPVVESVNIPLFTKFINDQGQFIADDTLNQSADDMMKELLKLTEEYVASSKLKKITTGI